MFLLICSSIYDKIQHAYHPVLGFCYQLVLPLAKIHHQLFHDQLFIIQFKDIPGQSNCLMNVYFGSFKSPTKFNKETCKFSNCILFEQNSSGIVFISKCNPILVALFPIQVHTIVNGPREFFFLHPESIICREIINFCRISYMSLTQQRRIVNCLTFLILQIFCSHI